MTDTHAGKGGSYTRDPVTGIRTLVERTEDAKPAETGTTEKKPAKAASNGGEK